MKKNDDILSTIFRLFWVFLIGVKKGLATQTL